MCISPDAFAAANVCNECDYVIFGDAQGGVCVCSGGQDLDLVVMHGDLLSVCQRGDCLFFWVCVCVCGFC